MTLNPNSKRTYKHIDLKMPLYQSTVYRKINIFFVELNTLYLGNKGFPCSITYNYFLQFGSDLIKK